MHLSREIRKHREVYKSAAQRQNTRTTTAEAKATTNERNELTPNSRNAPFLDERALSPLRRHQNQQQQDILDEKHQFQTGNLGEPNQDVSYLPGLVAYGIPVVESVRNTNAISEKKENQKQRQEQRDKDSSTSDRMYAQNRRGTPPPTHSTNDQGSTTNTIQYGQYRTLSPRRLRSAANKESNQQQQQQTEQERRQQQDESIITDCPDNSSHTQTKVPGAVTNTRNTGLSILYGQFQSLRRHHEKEHQEENSRSNTPSSMITQRASSSCIQPKEATVAQTMYGNRGIDIASLYGQYQSNLSQHERSNSTRPQESFQEHAADDGGNNPEYTILPFEARSHSTGAETTDAIADESSHNGNNNNAGPPRFMEAQLVREPSRPNYDDAVILSDDINDIRKEYHALRHRHRRLRKVICFIFVVIVVASIVAGVVMRQRNRDNSPRPLEASTITPSPNTPISLAPTISPPSTGPSL